ncbi:MAG: hypothetical protein KF787_11280 [Phycisphaeraceae bacterium]|nr:hypothetical protein [Phycisphaerae bacterium]MBX3393218.1 hypothetical protein [Phycisphaeraceae bacterium]
MPTNLRRSQARAWTVWTFATGLAACLALLGFQRDSFEEEMIELGLIFAGSVLSMGVIAGRSRDARTLLVIAWGGTMGMWCIRWLELWAMSVDRFLPMTGLFTRGMVESLGVPAAIAAAGAVSAALLLLATRSGRVAWGCLVATLIASAVPMFSDDLASSLPWAAAGWISLVTAWLAVWAVDESVRRSGAGCRSCGTDLTGLTSPVCPRCATPIPSSRRAVPAMATARERRPI